MAAKNYDVMGKRHCKGCDCDCVIGPACFIYLVHSTHLFLQLRVGVHPVHLPGLRKESSKGQGEADSQEPQTQLCVCVRVCVRVSGSK